MAPLTRNRAAADGVPTPIMATHYADRATAGLIIAEATTPNAVGQTYPNIPGLHTPAQADGWRTVTGAVRAAGGRMFVQLQHGGRVGHPDNSGFTPVAPSAVALPEEIHTAAGRVPSVVPREMTPDDIRSTAADFAAAARRAVEAGFEGVEVHSANGHLLHQFLAKNTNLRTDEYGGSVENRIRFTVEVVRAVAEAIGPERVGVRVSPGITVNGIEEGDTEALYPALVAALAEVTGVAGVAGETGKDSTRGERGETDAGGEAREHLAYLHVIFADPDQPLFHEIRKAWPSTLIANPNLGWGAPLPADGGRAAGERLLAAGADLISFGRGFLANPDLVQRLRTGAPLNPVRDRYLMYTGGETGYNDYPALGPQDVVPAA
ncbi:alkene reductase [Streptomyces sp. NPDC101115]|uniref:alkene reductase n=1 Tax=Streptomyces sp. NPDC101115 TaxID=3366106 RepID=UPI00380F0221